MSKKLKTSVSLLSLFVVIFAQAQIFITNAQAEFHPYRHNSDQKIIGKIKTSNIYTGWVNYYDNGFKKIDLSPRRKIAGGFRIDKAPYAVDIPDLANGEIKFHATNKWSISRDKPINDSPLTVIKKFSGAVPVSGVETPEGILYPSALPSVKGSILLQPYEEGFRYLVKWDSEPRCSGNMQIPFTIDLPFAPQNIRSEDQEVREIKVKTSKDRGVRFKAAKIWDSDNDRKEEEIVVKGRMEGNRFVGRKIVDCDFFSGKTYPVYTDTDSTFNPDPNPESSTFDGDVAFSDATWATAHSSSSALDVVRDDGTTELARVSTTFRIDRVIFGFDTGTTIPDTDTVSATTLQVAVDAKTDSDNDANAYIAVTAMSSAPASATAISATDYALITSTEWSDQVDITGISATGVYTTWTFNATGNAGVSKTGVTWMMFREGHDINNDAPNDTSGLDTIRMADYSGTSTDPLLTVTHAAAGGGSSGPPAGQLIFGYFIDFRTYA